MASVLRPKEIPTAQFRSQMIERAAQNTPLGRVAEAADIAWTAAFLASAESDFLTGVSLSVTGGELMD